MRRRYHGDMSMDDIMRWSPAAMRTILDHGLLCVGGSPCPGAFQSSQRYPAARLAESINRDLFFRNGNVLMANVTDAEFEAAEARGRKMLETEPRQRPLATERVRCRSGERPHLCFSRATRAGSAGPATMILPMLKSRGLGSVCTGRRRMPTSTFLPWSPAYSEHATG